MKNRVVCFALAMLLALAMCGTCLAITEASTTLSAYEVLAYTGDNSGELDIDYDIRAKKTATSVGISVLEIYTGNGIYVTTIYGNTTNGLMAKGTSENIGTYTYQGKPSTTYYAVATIEATIGSDYDSRIYATDFATTPA